MRAMVLLVLLPVLGCRQGPVTSEPPEIEYPKERTVVWRDSPNRPLPLATPLPAGTDPAATDPHVFYFEGFEDEGFRKRISFIDREPNLILSGEHVLMGERSLLVMYRQGSNFGGDLRYYFKKEGRPEPEELWARYYLRFDPGFEPGDGGKLPGPAGTYDRAGWGAGDGSDGYNGWAARMGYGKDGQAGHLLLRYYTANVRAPAGEYLHWTIDRRGSIREGRWYCIESYIKLNDPGRANGILRGWVDGHLAGEWTGVVFRETDALKIETYWVNHYYGGLAPSPRSQGVRMDNLALSTHRIGMASKPDGTAFDAAPR